MLLIDIRSTNASAAEFILYRLKLYLAGRHHHHHRDDTTTTRVLTEKSPVFVYAYSESNLISTMS